MRLSLLDSQRSRTNPPTHSTHTHTSTHVRFTLCANKGFLRFPTMARLLRALEQIINLTLFIIILRRYFVAGANQATRKRCYFSRKTKVTLIKCWKILLIARRLQLSFFSFLLSVIVSEFIRKGASISSWRAGVGGVKMDPNWVAAICESELGDCFQERKLFSLRRSKG